jgi:hypothetical protein
MYLFEAFNKKHARDVSISFIGHQLVVAIVFWGGYHFLRDATSLVNITIALALAAHAVRIFQLSRAGDILFTRLQIAYFVFTLPFIALLVAYACFNASRVTGALRLFDLVFLPLILATIFSVWLDFLMASFFQRRSDAGPGGTTLRIDDAS